MPRALKNHCLGIGGQDSASGSDLIAGAGGRNGIRVGASENDRGHGLEPHVLSRGLGLGGGVRATGRFKRSGQRRC
jgi:hypothetical protein